MIHHHHQSLNRKGQWGTPDDFATSFLANTLTLNTHVCHSQSTRHNNTMDSCFKLYSQCSTDEDFELKSEISQPENSMLTTLRAYV